jgi:hypothetical protein
MLFEEILPVNKVTIDPSLRAKLNGLNEHLEVCDENGRTLGFFLPPDLYHKLLYAWVKTQITDEEIAQARSEIKAEGGLTTSQAVAYLEKVACDAKGRL